MIPLFFGALAVVFLAELGDKTQLATLGLATRYPPAKVLIGVGLGFAVITGIGVLVGATIGAAIPEDVLTVVAGVLFLGFASRELWELRSLESDDDDDDDEVVERKMRSPILTSALTIGVAELGDKTQITAAALAARTEGVGIAAVWLGATLGELGACALAVLAGHLLKDRLSKRATHILAASAFLIAGLGTLATLAF